MPLHSGCLNILARYSDPKSCIEECFFEFVILGKKQSQSLSGRIYVQRDLAVKSA
ncbi:hypothetical protein SEN1985_45530 [Salmonella enterica subsp. enterica serovar Kentucky]|nr:hypothetical protein SEN1985_45530 [Salmonella enterica subsp. enterica serovar Kentucky]